MEIIHKINDSQIRTLKMLEQLTSKKPQQSTTSLQNTWGQMGVLREEINLDEEIDNKSNNDFSIDIEQSDIIEDQNMKQDIQEEQQIQTKGPNIRMIKREEHDFFK